MSAVFLPEPVPAGTPVRPTRRQQFFVQIRRLWNGPSDLAPRLRIEHQLVANRYLACLILAITLPLMQLADWQLRTAYILLAICLGYNAIVQMLIKRSSPLLRHGYVTSIGDSSLALAMVLIGQGFNSSLVFLLLTAALATGMRFGYGPSLLVVGIFIAFDTYVTAYLLPVPYDFDGNFFFRAGSLVLTALLSSFLWDQAQAAEQALARQLEYAQALNRSTRALGTSLDLDVVTRAVAHEARKMTNAAATIIQLGEHFGNLTFCDATRDWNASAAQLWAERLVNGGQPAVASPPAAALQSIANDGRRYIMLPLQSRQGTPGRLIVIREAQQPQFSLDDEQTLFSFIDRVVLAIENASLYTTIGDRSQDLQRAYADLAAAHQELLSVDEMKTSFIANVSHELRTPLTSIRSFSELLLSYDVDEDTKREFLGIINTESERLTRLINDVLDITKIEAGYVDWHMQPLEAADLLQTSCRAFRSVAEEKGLSVALALPDEHIFVQADKDRILQVLANLVGNAMKFTVKGEISLSVELINNMARIGVKDSGTGIDPADHERIFEKFHQVGDTLTDKPKGTGLGLCICRDIVQHHGGHIWVESALGQGSTFYFTLPLAPVPEACAEG